MTQPRIPNSSLAFGGSFLARNLHSQMTIRRLPSSNSRILNRTQLRSISLFSSIQSTRSLQSSMEGKASSSSIRCIFIWWSPSPEGVSSTVQILMQDSNAGCQTRNYPTSECLMTQFYRMEITEFFILHHPLPFIQISHQRRAQQLVGAQRHKINVVLLAEAFDR